MLPIETLNALFVAGEGVGNVTLRPATLAHLAAMEAFGVDVSKGIAFEKTHLVAWILTLDFEGCSRAILDDFFARSEMARWMEGARCSAAVLYPLVVRVLQRAFSAYVAGADDGKDGATTYSAPRGFGYPLEIAEFLCHEYGWTIEEAMNAPLARVYGMMNCARQRSGGKNGDFDYYERILQRAFKDAKNAAERAAADSAGDNGGKK